VKLRGLSVPADSGNNSLTPYNQQWPLSHSYTVFTLSYKNIDYTTETQTTQAVVWKAVKTPTCATSWSTIMKLLTKWIKSKNAECHRNVAAPGGIPGLQLTHTHRHTHTHTHTHQTKSQQGASSVTWQFSSGGFTAEMRCELWCTSAEAIGKGKQ